MDNLMIYKTCPTTSNVLKKLFGFEEKDKNLSQKSVFDLNFNDASYFE